MMDAILNKDAMDDKVIEIPKMNIFFSSLCYVLIKGYVVLIFLKIDIIYPIIREVVMMNH